MSFGIVICATVRTRKCGLDRFIHDVDDVRGPHHALVVRRDIHKQLVQIDILLVVRSDQVVKGVAGNREHRLAIAFRIIQPVQQMDSARAGSREANTQPACVLGVTASCECGSFFVPHLNEADLFSWVRSASKIPLTPSPGKPKIVFNAPVDQSLNQQVCYCFGHILLLAERRSRPCMCF